MARFDLKIYLTHSQVCIFLSSLAQPFNDWSDRSFSQGFAWREGSVSFRTLLEDGDHQINLFINEPVPELEVDVVRAFKVPFEILDGGVEIASISDSVPLEMRAGKYILQVELLAIKEDGNPEINIRLNKGETDFDILKTDDEIFIEGELDTRAVPAT